MERNAKALVLAALVWLLFGLSAAAHAQFLVIGDDNKLYWDDTGKTVFTEPGKDEVVIVDIKDSEAAGSVTVIDLKATPPHVVDYLGTDHFPEGLAINPTGDLAVALALNGSGGSLSRDAWFAHPNTIVDVLSTAGGTVRKVGAVNSGRQAEGVAFSPDGKYLYVANFYVGDFAPGNLQIYKVQGDRVVDTGKVLMLPGHPASMRSSVP